MQRVSLLWMRENLSDNKYRTYLHIYISRVSDALIEAAKL